jgi:hypothetical protein
MLPHKTVATFDADFEIALNRYNQQDLHQKMRVHAALWRDDVVEDFKDAFIWTLQEGARKQLWYSGYTARQVEAGHDRWTRFYRRYRSWYFD